MTHIDGTMEFKLRKPFKYSINGEFEDAKFLQLNEPTGKHNKNMRRLSAMVNSVILAVGAQRRDAAPVAAQPTPIKKAFSELGEDEHMQSSEDLAEMLAASFSMVGDVDMQEDFVEEFRKAVVRECENPICLVMGHDKAPFLQFYWENLHYKDQVDLAVKYAAFFGIGYLGDMTEK